MSTKQIKKRNTKRTKQNTSNKFVTHSQIKGGRFSPPTNPPDLTYQPWHPITLVSSLTGQKDNNLQLNHFLDILRKQLDPTSRGFNQQKTGDARFVAQFRFQSFQLWNLSGKIIALSITDFTESASASGGRDQLCGLIDTGSSFHIPTVGYTLPIGHQNHVLRVDDIEGKDIIVNIACGVGDNLMLYTRVLWRFDGPVKIPSISVSQIRDTSEEVERIAAAFTTNGKTSSFGRTVLNKGFSLAADTALTMLGTLLVEPNPQVFLEDNVEGNCSALSTSSGKSSCNDGDVISHLEDLRLSTPNENSPLSGAQLSTLVLKLSNRIKVLENQVSSISTPVSISNTTSFDDITGAEPKI